MHSPDNVEIAMGLIACVEANEALERPDATCFKVVVRSNSLLRQKTGLVQYPGHEGLRCLYSRNCSGCENRSDNNGCDQRHPCQAMPMV